MFKVGNTVKVIKNDSRSSNMVGDVGTITEIDDYGNVKVTVDGKVNSGNFHYPHDLEHFGPVRETTIVKKEIIPGTYDRLLVADGSTKYVTLAFGGDSMLSKVELASAIKTLQLIHDAME